MTHDLDSEVGDRLARASALARQAGVDAVLLTPGADLRYLSGYDAHPSERLTCLLVPAEGDPAFVAPVLESQMAAASPAGALGVAVRGWAETDNPSDIVAGLIGRTPRQILVADRMWAEHVFGLQTALPSATFRGAGHLLAELRMRKSPAEVDALRRAGAAIDAVHAAMGEWLRAGRTEREVGRDVADAILASGHATVEFTIVGSGPNGASPHHALSDRVVEAGDPVVIDIGGAMPDGYCSDSTRTYVVGAEPPAEFVEYYDVLTRGHAAAVSRARPGVAAEDVDAAAREVISDGGFGDHFIHRTGHGIGLEGHEHPYIVAGNSIPLEEGMAFSIEPGIYLAGRHGARIEDIVVCTADGVESMNRTDRAAVVLPG